MDNIRYTKQHEWIKICDSVAVIGITEFAAHELGDVTYVDVMAKVASEVEQEEVVATIESVKCVSDVYSPVSGVILETNQNVIDTPEIVNINPDVDGWLFKLCPYSQEQFNALMSYSDYLIYAGLLK